MSAAEGQGQAAAIRLDHGRTQGSDVDAVQVVDTPLLDDVLGVRKANVEQIVVREVVL